MTKLILHPTTQQQLENLRSHPPHALLISGLPGIGKGSVATHCAELFLELPSGEAEHYAYFRRLIPNDKNTISIEAIRELEHVLALKIPENKVVARVIIIEDAHALTTEAQNALLKTLEEPPADTVILLTTSHEQALLPTIRSRVQKLVVQKPDTIALTDHFAEHTAVDNFDQFMLISGGLPGLLASLLDETNEHPLKEAVVVARSILQKNAYERLLLVDELSKRKNFIQNICFILSQMADVALTKSSGAAFKRWQIILAASYRAQEKLLASGQPKLVLTHLMLEL